MTSDICTVKGCIGTGLLWKNGPRMCATHRREMAGIEQPYDQKRGYVNREKKRDLGLRGGK